jgi:hypothetical protein
VALLCVVLPAFARGVIVKRANKLTSKTCLLHIIMQVEVTEDRTRGQDCRILRSILTELSSKKDGFPTRFLHMFQLAGYNDNYLRSMTSDSFQKITGCDAQFAKSVELKILMKIRSETVSSSNDSYPLPLKPKDATLQDIEDAVTFYRNNNFTQKAVIDKFFFDRNIHVSSSTLSRRLKSPKCEFVQGRPQLLEHWICEDVITPALVHFRAIGKTKWKVVLRMLMKQLVRAQLGIGPVQGILELVRNRQNRINRQSQNVSGIHNEDNNSDPAELGDRDRDVDNLLNSVEDKDVLDAESGDDGDSEGSGAETERGEEQVTYNGDLDDYNPDEIDETDYLVIADGSSTHPFSDVGFSLIIALAGVFFHQQEPDSTHACNLYDKFNFLQTKLYSAKEVMMHLAIKFAPRVTNDRQATAWLEEITTELSKTIDFSSGMCPSDLSITDVAVLDKFDTIIKCRDSSFDTMHLLECIIPALAKGMQPYVTIASAKAVGLLPPGFQIQSGYNYRDNVAEWRGPFVEQVLKQGCVQGQAERELRMEQYREDKQAVVREHMADFGFDIFRAGLEEGCHITVQSMYFCACWLIQLCRWAKRGQQQRFRCDRRNVFL